MSWISVYPTTTNARHFVNPDHATHIRAGQVSSSSDFSVYIDLPSEQVRADVTVSTLAEAAAVADRIAAQVGRCDLP